MISNDQILPSRICLVSKVFAAVLLVESFENLLIRKFTNLCFLTHERDDIQNKPTNQHLISFSALTLLVGRQEERLACKNSAMRCWHLLS